jgi:hypothetical protein
MPEIVSDGAGDLPPQTPLEAANEIYSRNTNPGIGALFGAERGSGPFQGLSNAMRRGTQAGASWFDRTLLGTGYNLAEDQPGMPARPPLPEPEVTPTLQPDDYNERFAPRDLNGKIIPIGDQPMPEGLARIVGEQKTARLERDSILGRFAETHSGITNFAARTVASLQDPLNASLMFVPLFGEEAIAARLGGEFLARAAGRVGAGAATGALGAVPLTGLKMALDPEEASDYGMRDALRDVLYSAAGLAAFHTGIGTGFDILRGGLRTSPSRPPPAATGPLDATTQNAAMRSTIAQAVEGRPIDTGDFFYQPPRTATAIGLAMSPVERIEIVTAPDVAAQARLIAPDVFARYDPLVQQARQLRAELADPEATIGAAVDRRIAELRARAEAMRGEQIAPVGATAEELKAKIAEGTAAYEAASKEADTIAAQRAGLIAARVATARATLQGVDAQLRDVAATGEVRRAIDQATTIQQMAAAGRRRAAGEAPPAAPGEAPQSVAQYVDDYIAGKGRGNPAYEQFAANNAAEIEAEFQRRHAAAAPAIDDPLALQQRGELTAARAGQIRDELSGAAPEALRGAPDHADPEIWKVIADNLGKAEASREGGVSVVADQMQYMPADGVPKNISEREATAVIARAIDAEAARGGDVGSFLAEADAAYRAAGHGTPPDVAAAEAARAAASVAPLEGGIAGVEYRKLVAQGVPEVEARAQAALRQAHYEARSAAYPELGTAEELYRRDAPETVTAEAGELQPGELGQAPNETKGHPEGDAEDAAWRRIEPEKTAGGRYRGAPNWVTNGRRLGQLRRLIQQFIQEGLPGRFWYEDSAKKILQLTRGNLQEAEKFTGLLAIYSPQTAVFTNTSFAIKAFEQWKRGEPINVKTGSQDTRAQAWLDRGEDWGGRKTNSFYLNLMHELITENPEAVASLNLPADVLSEIRRATVDLWVLRAMGYEVDAAGGEGGTNKYGFSERELQRAAGMLNKDLPEGARRWLPHQVQAALWSAIKARYELPAVKEATWAESIKKGFAKMLPDQNGNLQRTAPGQSGPDKAGHMAVWRKHALAASAEDVAKQVESARGSFGDAIDRIAQNVTGEAVPSASLGHAINDASPEAKRQFTHDALQLLIDDDGNDVLAAQLGVNLNFNHIGAGLFEGNINPTVVTTLVPEKPRGFFDAVKARQYARAWQYIFKQDAVPIFRAEQAYDFKNDYSAVNPAGRVIRKFDTQRAAQAYADARPGWSIKGGDLSLGAHLEFAQDLDEAALRRLADGLQQELGPDAGFTKTGPRDVSVVNYRGENGLPFIDDVDFGDAIDRIVAREELGVRNVSNFGSEGEYGPVHDWQRDPSGSALAQAAGGSPALQSWMADRAAAFDALLEKWRNPESANAAAVAERDRIAGTAAAEPRPGGEPGTEPGGGPSTTGPPELEQAGRGKIRLATEDAKALITRYRDAADASTLIHEDFHQWTRELFDDAARPDAPPQIVADAATLSRAVGAEPGQPLTVEQLEQLAQWGEQYLREGKAPTPELQGVFDRFKAWLTEIYKTIVDLGIPLNDEVRGVYGRMLGVPEREAGAGDAMASFRTAGVSAAPAVPSIPGGITVTQRSGPDLIDLALRQRAQARAGWAPGVSGPELAAATDTVYGRGRVEPAAGTAAAAERRPAAAAGASPEEALLERQISQLPPEALHPEDQAMLKTAAEGVTQAQTMGEAFAQAASCLLGLGS